MLRPQQLEQFVEDGFVRIDGAFSAPTAAACADLLWKASGCDPQRPETWTLPVVRLGEHAEPPFGEAAGTAVLTEAFDQLVGVGRWLPRRSLGTFPLRFPSAEDPGDAGWHVDASFGWEAADFMEWRTNIVSRGRALLMLFLFSEVGDDDAPTRIRVGSHHAIARRLAPAGEAGLTLRELAVNRFDETAACAEVRATGSPGTVYLCHPFLVHAASLHAGTRPRLMAQPPLLPRGAMSIEGASPVERAIRAALT